MKRVKDFSAEDRPREKMGDKGAASLRDEDLVAILIGSGTRGAEVRKIASEISRLYRKKAHNVEEPDLREIKGVGDANAKKILAAVEFGSRVGASKKAERVELFTARDVWEELIDIRKSDKEHFVILYLNTRNKKIEKEVISIGTINASLVHPREVFRNALIHGASIVIAAHNHPSNEKEPSDADINITKRLIEAAQILGFEFQDHVIVTRDGYYSIKEHYEDLFE